jgi:hypothetical protein
MVAMVSASTLMVVFQGRKDASVFLILTPRFDSVTEEKPALRDYSYL